MFMFPLKVSNGGECLLITNRADLEKFVAFAQSYLALPTITLELEGQLPSHPKNNDMMEQPIDTIPPAIPGRQEYPHLSANDEWIKKAWKAVGEPAQGVTNRELYEAARKLGYASTAQDAIPAFKTAIRISSHMERNGTRDNAVLWKWTETPHETHPANLNRQPTQGTPSGYKGPIGRSQQNPQKGERAIDYAVQALKDAGVPLKTPQLAEIMFGLGWKPSGNPLDTLASTLRKSRYGDIVTNKNGFWVLVNAQAADSTTLPFRDEDLDLTTEELTTFTQT